MASWNAVALTPVQNFMDAGWFGLRYSVTGTGNDTLSISAPGPRARLDDVSLTAVPEMNAAEFPLGMLMSSFLLLASRRRRSITV